MNEAEINNKKTGFSEADEAEVSLMSEIIAEITIQQQELEIDNEKLCEMTGLSDLELHDLKTARYPEISIQKLIRVLTALGLGLYLAEK